MQIKLFPIFNPFERLLYFLYISLESIPIIELGIIELEFPPIENFPVYPTKDEECGHRSKIEKDKHLFQVECDQKVLRLEVGQEDI